MAATSQATNVKFASLDQWLRWQESLHVEDIDLGLDRCREVARKMGLNRPAIHVVTVAGTNGKGSSIAMLDAIWRAAGYSVATYTSPHLRDYNERIRVNGAPASDAEICYAFERVELARGSTPLTYFEFGTLAALSLFSEATLDAAILEVGLGGRLDAVNIIDADVALIATIGIDHVEYLGGTRAEIALEKAGIMRSGKPAVCSDIDIPQSLMRRACELPTRLEVLGQTYHYVEDDDDTWSWWSGEKIIAELPKPSLLGSYQLGNAAGVIKVIETLMPALQVAEMHIATGLKETELRGRFQVIPGDVELVLDVAHNAQAVAAMVGNLQAHPTGGNTHILLGMLRVKDRDSVIRLLEPVADSWHLATVVGRRGATGDELYESLKQALGKRTAARTYDCAAAAYDGAINNAKSGDRIVALGSFLVVSEVMRCLS